MGKFEVRPTNKITNSMDTVSWEWTALSTKIAMDYKLPLFLADVLIKFYL